MRTPCPACGKSHNSASVAIDCRMRKANELSRRPRVEVYHVGFTAFKEYLAAERRGDAVGGTE